MLKPTSLIMGAGLGYDVACLTDGRFSGGWVMCNQLLTTPSVRQLTTLFSLYSSHGFVIGHVTPEAQVGGPIALVQDGDMIHIDAELNSISMDVTDAELDKRRKDWKAPPLKVTSGTLYKYTKLVSDASQGCVTDA